jgi:hypothetical protein
MRGHVSAGTGHTAAGELIPAMHLWETIAQNIHAAGWSYGEVMAIEDGGPVWIVDAKKEHSPRLWAKSSDKLTAYRELLRLVRQFDSKAGTGRN